MITIATLIATLATVVSQADPVIDDIRALTAALNAHFTGGIIPQETLDAAQAVVDKSNADMNTSADAAIARHSTAGELAAKQSDVITGNA